MPSRWKNVMVAVVVTVALALAALSLRKPAIPSSAVAAPRPLTAALAEPSPSPVQLRGIVLYGHSMPFGRGASTPAKSYAQLLSAALHVPVANYAVGGLEFPAVEKIVMAHPAPNPDTLVILHVGLNDIDLRGTKPSLVGDGQAAMSNMIGYLSQQGARVVVMSECRPLSWSTAPAPFDKGSDVAFNNWNAMVKDVVAHYHSAVLDTACTDWDTKTMIDSSGYHPNDAGHALIAKSVLRLIGRT